MCYNEEGDQKVCRNFFLNVSELLERHWNSKISYVVMLSQELTYLGDSLSAGGGCEAAVIA